MVQIAKTPLFLMESEIKVFSQQHPDYKYYKPVYYSNETLAGYLAYKDEPQN